MFVLELTYTAPADRVDVLLPARVAWLDEQYTAGAAPEPERFRRPLS
ncbi:hypothetical protein [Streptomyces sp. NPDC102360]